MGTGDHRDGSGEDHSNFHFPKEPGEKTAGEKDESPAKIFADGVIDRIDKGLLLKAEDTFPNPQAKEAAAQAKKELVAGLKALAVRLKDPQMRGAMMVGDRMIEQITANLQKGESLAETFSRAADSIKPRKERPDPYSL